MQVLVIGAGVIGLAVARAVARQGHEVVVAEAANAIGTGISSRNSEVIHGGMYYPTGTLRARHCVRGRRMLYEFCASHGVPHRKCGKLIVATNQAELDKIEAIEAQGRINGVEGLETDRRQRGARAGAGIVLHRRAAFAGNRHHRRPCLYAGAARRSRGCGRRDRLQHEGGARGAQRRTMAGRVRRQGEAFAFDAVVNCAGLGAQAVARAVEDYPAARVPRWCWPRAIISPSPGGRCSSG